MIGYVTWLHTCVENLFMPSLIIRPLFETPDIRFHDGILPERGSHWGVGFFQIVHCMVNNREDHTTMTFVPFQLPTTGNHIPGHPPTVPSIKSSHHSGIDSFRIGEIFPSSQACRQQVARKLMSRYVLAVWRWHSGSQGVEIILSGVVRAAPNAFILGNQVVCKDVCPDYLT